MNITSKIHVLLFFLFSSLCFGQDKSISDRWLDSYEAGVAQYKSQSYQQAIDELEKAKVLLPEIDFSNSPDYIYYPVYNYDYLANSYFYLGQYENAAANFMSAVEEMSKIPEADIEYGKNLLNGLINSYQQYDLEAASQVLQQMLDNMEGTSIEDLDYYIQTLYKLASIEYSQQKKTEARELWKKGLQLLEEKNRTDNEFFPLLVFNLAYDSYHAEDYSAALPYFAQAISIQDRYASNPSIDLGMMKSQYGQSAYKAGEYDLAVEILSSLNEQTWSSDSKNSEQFLYNNNYIGLSNYFLGNLEAAETAYLISLENLKRIKDTDPCLFELQNTNLVRLYINARQYKPAIAVSEKTYQYLEEKNATSCQAYTNAVNNLGLLYMYNSRYEDAFKFLKKALDLQKNSDNPDPLFIADITNNLAFVSQEIGDYASAKKYHEAALETKTQLLGKSSIGYAAAIANYATFLFQTGSFHQAEDKFLEALAILESNVGKESKLVIEQQLNLAMVYQSMRRLKESLAAYQTVINYYQNSAKEDEMLANALMGKAFCLHALGDTTTALTTAEKSLQINEKLFGESGYQYGEAITACAQLLYANGSYNEADKLINEAYENFKNNFSSGSKQNIQIIEYRINDLLNSGEFEEASKIIEIYEPYVFTNYGFKSYEYAQLLVKKIRIYNHYKEYDYAFEVYDNVKDLFQNDLSTDSDIYNQLIFGYAKILEKAGKTDRAISEYQDFFEGINSRIESVFTYRNEEEKKLFLQQLQGYQDWLNATIATDSDSYAALIPTALNNQLLLKSLLLNSSRDVLSSLTALEDSDVEKQIDLYYSLKSQLSNPAVLKDSEKSKKLKSELADVESLLVKKYDEKIGKSRAGNFSRDWKKVQQALESSEVAIEFFEFETRDENGLTGKKEFAAFLIQPNQDLPRLIKLCDSSALKNRLKTSNPKSLYKSRGSRSKNNNAYTEGLYDLIWRALENYVEQVSTIYFSPSGVLNQIPFVALADEDGKLLLEKHKLFQLSSTYNITKPEGNESITSALLVGGVNYDATGSVKPTVSAIHADYLKNSKATRGFDSSWNYLPGTLSEIQEIDQLLKPQLNIIKSLSQANASEIKFKELSGKSPDVIHIATHGYFFENQDASNSERDLGDTSVYALSKDPLLRSGLLFAGANKAWLSNGQNLDSNDGMLTALEISNLDLSNTQLAVLSACETGLGDIEGSEGVYGLQRAFKMAGVNTLIMSLWEVPDQETSEFMQHFYQEWMSSKNLQSAFRNTQLVMASKYKDRPEKWAAFVLFE
jgi:CHAT domain-containing protein/lipopolysaccharide biosynthesis regulator YciM